MTNSFASKLLLWDMHWQVTQALINCWFDPKSLVLTWLTAPYCWLVETSNSRLRTRWPQACARNDARVVQATVRGYISQKLFGKPHSALWQKRSALLDLISRRQRQLSMLTNDAGTYSTTSFPRHKRIGSVETVNIRFSSRRMASTSWATTVATP